MLGGNPSPASFPGVGAPGTTVTLDAGPRRLTANVPAGYQPTFSTACSAAIAVGETKTCTITHDDPQGCVGRRQVVNDNGGSAVAGDFTVTVTGGHPSPASFPGAGAPPGTRVRLDAGPYSVTASGPAGYDSVPGADCAGILVATSGAGARSRTTTGRAS